MADSFFGFDAAQPVSNKPEKHQMYEQSIFKTVEFAMACAAIKHQ